MKRIFVSASDGWKQQQIYICRNIIRIMMRVSLAAFSFLSTSWSSWLEFREAPRLISISFLLQQLWLHFAFDSQDMKSLCDHFRSTTISLYEGHPGEEFKTRFKDSARRHTWSFSWNAITRNSDFYNNPASPNGPHIPSIFALWTSKIFVYILW